MMAQNLDLKAGELLVFSTGSYSDYGYQGSYVVLRDIASAEMEEIATQINSDGDKYDSQDRFQAELIRRGCLLTINMREIHLGDWGEVIL